MTPDKPQFYWEILEYDGTVTRIPPESVETVRSRRERGLPIKTATRDITDKQIKSFHITGERYTDRLLLEDASRAFHAPIMSKVKGIAGDYEAVQAKWVKKTVPMDRWQRYYSVLPSYKFLEEQHGMAVIAFVVATHDIDLTKVDYCSEVEIQRLT